MKIFNQENGIEKVYVQVGDLAILAKINAKTVPQTIMQKTLDNMEMSEKDFIEFTSPEELDFFSATDWIIDYRIASKQPREITEGHTKLLATEISDISYSLDDLAEQEGYLKEVLNCEYEIAYRKLIQYQEIIDIKDQKEELSPVPDPDSKKIKISTDTTEYIIQRSIDSSKLMLSRVDGKKLSESDNSMISMASACLELAKLHLSDTKGEIRLGNESFTNTSPDGRYLIAEDNNAKKLSAKENVKVKEKNSNN